MTKKSMLSLKPKNKTDNNTPGKSAALQKMGISDNYIDGVAVVKTRIDLDKRLHKAIKDLANSTECITISSGGEVKEKNVSIRMLMTEFILDGLSKYKNGDGNYSLADNENWTWEDE